MALLIVEQREEEPLKMPVVEDTMAINSMHNKNCMFAKGANKPTIKAIQIHTSKFVSKKATHNSYKDF